MATTQVRGRTARVIRPQKCDQGDAQMINALVNLLIAALVLQPETTVQTPMTIPDGTPLRIRINQTISSADAKVGQTVDFEILDEVKVGDVVVIPKGGLALATVTEAQSKKTQGEVENSM